MDLMKCVAALRAAPEAYLDVREDVQHAYNEDVQRRLAGAVWASGCSSWYIDAHGRNSTLWPGFCFQYRLAARRFE